MPDWMRPRQQWFDTAAADMAIEAVAALRFVLTMSWDVEADAARTALIGWNGRAARAFDASVSSRAERVDQLHRQLGALQADLEAAVDEARRDQLRVDELQRRWDRELEAEHAAERRA